MPKDLFSFFNPKSIAIIGASRDIKKVGNILLTNIINSGYKGKIFPVNPKTDSILNIKCFPNIESLPEIPELVLISLPAATSLLVLNEVAAKGVKNVILYASGFKEIGGEGLKLEDSLISIISKYSLNVLGPNCLGFVNNNLNLNATFGNSNSEPGKIKYISQSGAIAASIFDWSLKTNVGINEFITIGNKTNLTEIDILNYFMTQSEREGDSSNFPIGMYLESISNGSEFISLCSKLSKKHPIFILKPGKTEESSSAMKSHTGSLTGSDDVLNSALLKAGVIRCNSLEEFFIASKTFSLLPYAKSQNVTIISNAGGPAVISADSIIENNLKLTQNPIDLLGDALANKYLETGAKFLLDKNTDSILFILTPQTMTEIDKTAQAISAMALQHKKVVVASFLGGQKVQSGITLLSNSKIPVFDFPEQAIKSLSFLNQFDSLNKHTFSGDFPSRVNHSQEVLNIISQPSTSTIDNISADKIIKELEINVPESIYFETYESAIQFANKFNFEVVIKISGDKILHKKDLGGVISNIKNESEFKDSIEAIKTKFPNTKIQIQQKVKSGIEIITGIKKDSVFGAILLFGIGGSFVEILQDKNIVILPALKDEIKHILKNSKVQKILTKENIDSTQVIDVLFNFSKSQYLLDKISEIEINPLILNSDGILAVDTKIILPTINKEIL